MIKHEMNSSYYDKIYKISPHYSVNISADSSRYKHLYNFVASRIDKNDTVLELGCGTGQFADKLIKDVYKYILGIDFSQEAIKYVM